MKILSIVLLFLITYCMAVHDSKYKWNFPESQENKCEENNLDCQTCLRQESCSWCGVDVEHSSSCISSEICPITLQHSSCPERHGLEEQLQTLYNKKEVVFDVPQVTLNATYLCHLKRNCTECTGLGFCAWCAKKKACVPYAGALTTNLCGSKSWYRNHCVTSGAQRVKPCPERTSGCKECLGDGVCYWCDSPKYCGYYQGDGVEPANCTSHQWYYQECSNMKAYIVLLPILIIISTPVIAYIVMFCVICIMKEAGYDVKDESDSSDDEEKIRKPIMLRHDSPGSKTDKLRKKYGLDKKP